MNIVQSIRKLLFLYFNNGKKCTFIRTKKNGKNIDQLIEIPQENLNEQDVPWMENEGKII